MWLVGMMFGHSLEHMSHIIGDLRTQGLCHDCAHGRFIGLDTGRQPQGGRASPFRDVSCAMLECPAAKRLQQRLHSHASIALAQRKTNKKTARDQ
jgi:hypothetical protein